MIEQSSKPESKKFRFGFFVLVGLFLNDIFAGINFPTMPLRTDFPPAGNPSYLDGECDGFVYKLVFGGTTLKNAYEMVCSFLDQEGYSDVPRPSDFKEMELFRLNKKQLQLRLFEENGYLHNPVKILFPENSRKKNELILFLYNEKVPDNLLRFHGKLDEK